MLSITLQLKADHARNGGRRGTGARRDGAAQTAATSSAGVTMQSVAEMAGVSAMTVSRALKSDAAVSAETRNRILEIVKQTGYVPDATARGYCHI
jgi:hypothetical protein